MDELKGLTAAELLAKRDANAARHAELAAKPKTERTFAESAEMRDLAKEVTEIDKLTVAILEDSILPEAPKPVEAKPVADNGAHAPIVHEVASTVPGQEPSTPVEDPAVFAESVAAAANLASLVNARPVVIPDNEGTRIYPDRVVRAAASFGHEGVGVGEAIDLDQFRSIVERRGGDRNPQRERVDILDVQAATKPVLFADASPAANTAALAKWFADREAAESGSSGDVQAAAFTICGPPDILRSVPTDCVDDTRYVPSWFDSVPTEHGAIQFYRPLGMADVANAVTVWGQTEQSAIDSSDPDTWKPCASIPCLPTVTVGVEEIVQCLTLPAFQYMTAKEATASALAATRAVFARTADGHLLKLYDVLASKYTWTPTQTHAGAFINIYDLLGRIEGAVAASVRQPDLAGYTLAVEAGFMATLELDSLMACNPRGAAEAAASLFGGLGFGKIAVTPDWSTADGGGPWSAITINDPGNAAAALFARPTSFKVRIFRSKDFAIMAPGGEALGIVPDLDNKRQNKLTMFGANYQGLAKLGCAPAFSIAISGLNATGTRAACA